MLSEFRKDYLLNKYVIITPARAKRPRDITEQTMLNRDKQCVFCPEHIEKELTVDELADGKLWRVLAVKNKFPAVSLNNKKAYGTQEIIIETPRHGLELEQLSDDEVLSVMEMYQRRTAALSKIKGLDYILVFKNSGSKAGASLLHAHSQIFATDIIPPDVQEEMTAAAHYQAEHKSNAYADIIKKEIKSQRVVYADKYIAAFCPYASQFHYEVWILPRRFIDNITELNAAEMKAFAKILKKILAKLRRLGLSYNFFMHQVISNSNQRFYLKIQPRDSVWAGVELGSGIVINSVAPEAAAKFYRASLL